MKKIIAMILCAGLCLLSACGTNNTQTQGTSEQGSETITDSSSALDEENGDDTQEPEDTGDDVQTETEDSESGASSGAGSSSGSGSTGSGSGNSGSGESGSDNQTSDGSIAQTLADDFKKLAADGGDTLAIAEALIANEIIEVAGATMEVVPGNLNGFTDAITGFENGAMFAPMIGTIPFVGYVFELSDENDVDAFMSLLSSNADPRWNICTEADDTVITSSGKLVFFVMSPSEF